MHARRSSARHTAARLLHVLVVVAAVSLVFSPLQAYARLPFAHRATHRHAPLVNRIIRPSRAPVALPACVRPEPAPAASAGRGLKRRVFVEGTTTSSDNEPVSARLEAAVEARRPLPFVAPPLRNLAFSVANRQRAP